MGAPNKGKDVGDPLNDAMLRPIVEEAIAYWSTMEVDAVRLGALTQIDVRVGDLSGSLLGLAASDSIVIDRNAAGFGWSVASGGFDLHWAVTHELGHVLGFDHDHPLDVTRATLAPEANRVSAAIEFAREFPAAGQRPSAHRAFAWPGLNLGLDPSMEPFEGDAFDLILRNVVESGLVEDNLAVALASNLRHDTAVAVIS